MLHHKVILLVYLTNVTSRDYVTNINMWKTSDVMVIPYLNILYPHMGPHTTPGPQII